MSKRFDVQTCHICGEIEFEDKMIEHNDKWVCGITCHLKLKGKEDERLNQNDARGDDTVVPYRPVICRDN
jgi:ribosomal protein S27AE